MNIQQMLLNKLRAQNPKGYEALMEIQRSGRNPYDVLSEMKASGEITESQYRMAERQARLLFSKNAPQEKPASKNPFKGLF